MDQLSLNWSPDSSTQRRELARCKAVIAQLEVA